MGHWLRSQSHGKTQNIGHVVVATKRYMQWTTPWFWTTMDCLFILIWATLDLITMQAFFTIWPFIKSGQYFTHRDDCFEYFLGDLGYLGEEMFIMRTMGRWGWELPLDVDHGAFHAYNKRLVGFKVQVEWKIGGLKWKWRHLMKRFDFTKPIFSHLFQVGILLTNYLHRHWMDFTYKVIGDYNFDPAAQGWVGDYLWSGFRVWN